MLHPLPIRTDPAGKTSGTAQSRQPEHSLLVLRCSRHSYLLLQWGLPANNSSPMLIYRAMTWARPTSTQTGGFATPVPTTKRSAVPLPQAVPLLGLDTPAAGPRARRPLGPLAPPVGSHIRTLLQAVGGLWHVLLMYRRVGERKSFGCSPHVACPATRPCLAHIVPPQG